MRASPLTALPRSVRLLHTTVNKLFTRCTSCTNTCTTAVPKPQLTNERQHATNEWTISMLDLYHGSL